MNQRWHDGKIKCGKCKILKDTVDFYRNNSREDGYGGHCKVCEKLYHTEPRKKPKKNHYKPVTNSVYQLNEVGEHSGDRNLMRHFYSYRNQVKRRGIVVFELTLDDFAKLTRDTVCNYCGLLSPGKEYVGIDRVDSSQGYIMSNCVPCCSICNRMKLDLGLDAFIDRVKRIYHRWAGTHQE